MSHRTHAHENHGNHVVQGFASSRHSVLSTKHSNKISEQHIRDFNPADSSNAPLGGRGGRERETRTNNDPLGMSRSRVSRGDEGHDPLAMTGTSRMRIGVEAGFEGCNHFRGDVGHDPLAMTGKPCGLTRGGGEDVQDDDELHPLSPLSPQYSPQQQQQQ